MLDIPVIGPGRASMLTAMLLGSRFSVVTMWKHWFHLYEKTIGDLGAEFSGVVVSLALGEGDSE